MPAPAWPCGAPHAGPWRSGDTSACTWSTGSRPLWQAPDPGRGSVSFSAATGGPSEWQAGRRSFSSQTGESVIRQLAHQGAADDKLAVAEMPPAASSSRGQRRADGCFHCDRCATAPAIVTNLWVTGLPCRALWILRTVLTLLTTQPTSSGMPPVGTVFTRNAVDQVLLVARRIERFER